MHLDAARIGRMVVGGVAIDVVAGEGLTLGKLPYPSISKCPRIRHAAAVLLHRAVTLSVANKERVRRCANAWWNACPASFGKAESSMETKDQEAPPEESNATGWRPPAGTPAGLEQFISFAIGNDQYGVDIMSVREIKGWSEVTHLPRQPEYIRGVLNLRGVMVPIIDLRCRFGQGKTDAGPMHVVIIVSVDNRLVGLLADRVLDIVTVEVANIQPVPQLARTSRVAFLAGLVTLDSTMIALIDLANLIAASNDADNATGSEAKAASPMPKQAIAAQAPAAA
jgi:purine-binding chemotaxis protein CheW